VHRPKNSEKRLQERLEENEEQTREEGILEIFDRDEDAPLARDGDSDEDE
jgi:hypothetical protein